MAGHYYYAAQTGSVTLSSATTRTLWQLDPVTNPVTIIEWGISFDASASSTAVRVDLLTQTTAGTASSLTVIKWSDQNAPSATTTAQQTFTSSEPTTGVVLASYFIQPFGGNLIIQYPLTREPGTAAAATGQRLALRYVAPSGVTPNCVSYVVWDEG